VSASQSCSDSIGAWGIAGDTWDLSHNANGKYTGVIGLSATGAIAAIGHYPHCSGQQYAIIGGSRNGTTVAVSGVQLGTVTGGQPNPDCPANVSASVTMAQSGCDHGAAIVSLDGSGISQQWTSTCFKPTGEVTAFDYWDTPDSNPIQGIFHATMQPTTFNFGGRYIKETFPAADNPNPDGCYFAGSRKGRYIPTEAPGHYEDSSSGNRYEDDIGFDGDGPGTQGYDVIYYYRSVGKAPCSFRANQRMTVDCQSGPTTFGTLNHIVMTIGDAARSVSRSGVPSGEKVYGRRKRH